MFCKKDNHFVWRNSLPHILVRTWDYDCDELAHHKVKVKCTQMLRKTADYKLQEVEGLKINLWILISQKMSHQQAERFDELSSALDTDLI